jgi:hypothetical protein
MGWPGDAIVVRAPQQRYKTPVIPAKAGTQSQLRMVPVAAVHLGPGFRRDDA